MITNKMKEYLEEKIKEAKEQNFVMVIVCDDWNHDSIFNQIRYNNRNALIRADTDNASIHHLINILDISLKNLLFSKYDNLNVVMINESMDYTTKWSLLKFLIHDNENIRAFKITESECSEICKVI